MGKVFVPCKRESNSLLRRVIEPGENWKLDNVTPNYSHLHNHFLASGGYEGDSEGCYHPYSLYGNKHSLS